MNIKDFDNKKILIVLPHEDDEICFTGGLLASINNKNTRVVYTTNGNFIYSAKYRYKEAIKSCKKFGISEENIIFLGYSDSPYDSDNHMYTSDGIWTDKHGNSSTFGTNKKDEYCYIKNRIHNKFTKKNLINDIKYNILDFKPEIIIGIDLDFHPDHIMTSLCLEKAIGELLKENSEYTPIVLKGFAYENAYWGPNDYNDKVIKQSNYNYDSKGYLISNPYYSKDNLISIDLDRRAYTRNIFKNKLYKSILCHISQGLVEKAFSIINPNIVLWNRDTNNLINKAKIEVSSGNKEYLNDFILCDSNNILNGNKKKIVYDKGIWIPDKDDSKRTITITFDSEQYIDVIKIYNGMNNNNFIKNVFISIDNDNKIIENNENILCYKITKNVKEIIIKILDSDVKNGFSEIELLKEDDDLSGTNNNTIYNDGLYSKIINIIINKSNTFFTKVYRKLFLRKQ